MVGKTRGRVSGEKGNMAKIDPIHSREIRKSLLMIHAGLLRISESQLKLTKVIDDSLKKIIDKLGKGAR